MYKLMISFKESKKLEYYGISPFSPQEFLISSPTEVCKIITKLSHLRPIITLQEVSVVNADFVLDLFEAKKD